MINLLPGEAKKNLKREQRLRFLSVTFLLMAFVSLIALLLSIPTGILLSRHADTLAGSMDLAEAVEKRSSDVKKDLAHAASLIEHLSKSEEEGINVSSMIYDLDQLAGEEVLLTHFNFDDKKKIVLSGIASTRSTLSLFRDRLDGDDRFKSVELPLSSLVKDTEVPFSITLTLK